MGPPAQRFYMNDEAGPGSAAKGAESSARAGTLLSTVCHDLRSPLSAIVMGTDFLRRSLAKEGMAAESRVLEGVARSAKRLDTLIANLHDVAQLEAGRFTVEAARVDVDTLLRAVSAAQEGLGAPKGVTLEVATITATFVACDRARILKALGALVDNAVRYSPANGIVTVGVETEEGRVTFSVSDKGAGMSEERRAHAFDHTWHATQSPRDGTGLGLAIVHGIALAHGGGASVESGAGTGTRVSFWIPTG